MESSARTTPLVSIVCDTYNQSAYIGAALDGFLMQRTDFPIEIIVHDDASTDGTADIVRAYERAHPALFRCVYRTENVYSRDPKILEHYVFPLARGKYVAICEGDDCWTDPDKLQRQIDYMEAHPECTLCVHGAQLIEADGRVVGSVAPYGVDTDVPMDALIRGGGGFVATASIVAPARLCKLRAPYCDLTEVDDAPLLLWFAQNGTVRYLAGNLCAYRLAVPGSWTESTLAAGSERRIRVHEEMIAMLQAFDLHTDGRWHEACDEAVRYHTFSVLCLRHDIAGARSAPYRVFWRELSHKRRLRLRLEKLFPRLSAACLGRARARRPGKGA